MAPALMAFLLCYVLSFVVVMGVNEWFFVWAGLEMNMFSFISMFYKKESWRCVESMYSYFFVQGLSSGVFLVFLYLGWSVEVPLMMKIAAGPFFFWFPSVMEGVGWIECLVLMTLQKFLPLVLLSGMASDVFIIWGLLGMIVGVVGSYGQVCLSSLMAYSSVNHVGWIMASQAFGGGLWLCYFVVYFLVVGVVVMNFIVKKMEGVEDVVESSYDMFVFVVSMSGVPPFLGFAMKWVVLEKVLGVSLMAVMMMIFFSLVMIYVYVRVVYDSLVGGGDMEGWLMMGSGGLGLFMVMSLVGTMMLPLFVWWIL